MPEPKRDRPSWIRYSGLGIELAAAFLGFALLGYWVDHHYETEPWGLLIGAVLGLIGGMYNMVREALAAFQPPKSSDRHDDKDHPHQP